MGRTNRCCKNQWVALCVSNICVHAQVHMCICAHARVHMHFRGECGMHFDRCCEHHACSGVYVRQVL